ncbi:hypothetical protein EG829_32010, partial [bacterium]|nr:hypothetical protein [bacterium]
MKGKHFYCLGILWLTLFAIPTTLLGDTIVQKGSSITTNDADLQFGIVSSKHYTPAGIGTLIYDGIIEYYPASGYLCNRSTFTGEFTNGDQATFENASVLERRFTTSGTVSSGGTVSLSVSSTVEYSIVSGPSHLLGITIRRTDWENGPYTGTTYLYFRSDSGLGNIFFGGHVDGDI